MERVSRRIFLQVSGFLGLGTMVPPSLRADTRKRILPLVIFFQGGAQSPYEFVSPLVNSPKELRGEVETMKAKNGMPIDDRWSHFARVADQSVVIRSLDCQNTSHDARPVVSQPGQYAQKLAAGGLPHPFIEMPSIYNDLSQLNANLGMHIVRDKIENRFKPPTLPKDDGLAGKADLLHKVERPLAGSAVELWQKNRDLAEAMTLGGGKVITEPFRKAEQDFDRYGRNPIGEGCALASNFAQAGAGVTLVYNELGKGWDQHNNIKGESDILIPPTSMALEQLILDARRFGFVLLMTSEHGRTPKINPAGGRDHHNVGYAVLAGGRAYHGAVIGAVGTDGNIRNDPVTGPQLMKTVLEACGIDQPNRGELVPGAIK